MAAEIKPLTDSGKLLKIKVSEIMNSRPRIVFEDTSISGLFERMLGQIEDCFPVVDKDFKLIGIVTESDLFQVFYPKAPVATVGSPGIRNVLKYSAEKVGDIMTKRPIAISPEATLGEAMNLMASHKIRRLPIVSGDKLVGLLSLRDIIDLFKITR